MLVAAQLGWIAGKKPIVRQVDLSIRKNEVFGLVGPNGSGKSTLLMLLAGLRAPSAGSVSLEGVDLRSLRRREIAQRIAIVIQQLETTDRLTVRQTVDLGRTPWLGPVSPFAEDDKRIVDKALAETGITHLADRTWQTLSGGERQRAHIARALAQRADILLLDEPTNHLDIHHQLAILELVKSLPITVILALHDLNQAMECDRVGLMEGGRLIAAGTPEDVLSMNRIEQAFDVRMHHVPDQVDGRTLLRFSLPPHSKQRKTR